MQATANTRKRDDTIDAIKAFAIICVVIAHCIQYGSGQTVLLKELYFEDGLFRFICSFHMPLFMLVSGYLFSYSLQRGTFKAILGKRLRTLILPVLSWAVVVLGIKILSVYVNEGHFMGVKDLFSDLLFTFFHHQWFLWAIFWCSMIVMINRLLFKDSLLFYSLFLILTLFLPNKHNMALYGFMYPYFVIGYLYNKDWKDRVKPYSDGILPVILSWALFITLLLFYDRDSFIYTSGYCILKDGTISWRHLGIDVYRFLIGLTGSIAIIGVVRLLYARCKSVRFKNAVSFIGMNTLGIYIISGVVFNDHLLKTTTLGLSGINDGIVLLETIVVIAGCLALSWMIKKIKILNLLLLGGR